MKIDRQLTRNLAYTADITSLVGGGTIFPTFETSKQEDHYRLKISAPSISPDDIKVEVNSGHLFVYQKIENKDSFIPNMLGVQKIAANVDLNNITAEYEDEVLVVKMPFNELMDGFTREIDIHKN